MLYINDPDAYRAIIQERRHDDGQHIATVTDVTPRIVQRDEPSAAPPRRYDPAAAASG